MHLALTLDPIDPTKISAAIAAGWQPRLGRVDPTEAGTCACGKHQHEASYRARWVNPATAEVRDQLLCNNRAAAWSHAAREAGADVPFPPGAWKNDGTVGRAPQVFDVPPGTPVATCSSCRANVRWIVTANQKRMPVDLDGTSHFVSCPNRDQHRKTR